MPEPETSAGLVVLVGAGPGNPELATLAAAKWLSRADIVFYDRLLPASLLGLARPDAERIYVGKTPGLGGPEQDSINEMLIRHARAGRLVVRLKGGDPLVFGRGGEEAAALAAAGVPFRIVPGVTAATAAAACAGIPLTDRQYASSVAFVTARERPDKPETALDWPALARIDTLVVYMTVANLPETVSKLIQAGRDPRTPSAIIASASTGGQRTVTASLADLPAAAEDAGIAAPAVAIIGKVAELRREPAWFEALPLFGRKIIVTRPARQAAELSDALIELGAAPIEAAAIEIGPPADAGAADAVLRRLDRFGWLVFTSVNGVEAFVARCRRLGLDARSLGAARLAAVGPATAGALRRNFLEPDIVPERFTTADLGQAIRVAGDPPDRPVLLVRGDSAGPALAEQLRASGADVEEVAVYRTSRPAALPDEAIDALRRRQVHWVTFASPSAVANFAALLGPQAKDLLAAAKLAAIGPVTAQAIEQLGLAPAAVADPHTIAGLVQAIVRAEA